MTRKEEIQKEATLYSDDLANFCTWNANTMTTCVEVDDKEYIKAAFQKGAEWADNHPVIKVGGAAKNYQRGYETAVKRACEWLKQDMLNNLAFQDRLERMSIINGIIENFRKAMEI